MSRWVDEDDDLTNPPAPVRTKTADPEVVLETSFVVDPKTEAITKVVKRIRVVKESRRISKRVLARRTRMKRFGNATGSDEQENVTIQSKDDITIENPNAVNTGDGDDADDPSKALAGNLNAFWAKQQRRQLERKYDVNGEPEGEEGKTDGPAKYVPPGQRGAAGAAGGKSLESMAANIEENGRKFDDRDQNTIRVTNISEDTTEADLQDLFSPFGRISRVYLAKDRETMQSRGFAFISFVHHDDASTAMQKLQGFGYDHLILKLEWARPSGGKGDAGSERTEFRSGYGKALAQDTKEKVSFASNLTK